MNVITGNVLIAAVCGAGVGLGLLLVIRGLAGVPVHPEDEAKSGFGAWLEKAKAPGTTRKVLIALAAAVLVGAAIFLALQAGWKTPELGWLVGGLNQLRMKNRRVVAEAFHG